jgi:hypothetical protein
VFYDDHDVIVYYLPNTTGWGATLAGRPAVLWNPEIKTSDANFGVQTNGFGFTMTGTAKIPIVVEACSDLVNPMWIPLQNIKLTSASYSFRDLDWLNHSNRFYRINTP